MAVVMGSLYAALVKAGAGEDDAKRAAEEVANFEFRINGLEAKIDRLDAKVSLIDQKGDSRFMFLSWMIGVNMALTVTILGIILRGVVVR